MGSITEKLGGFIERVKPSPPKYDDVRKTGPDNRITFPELSNETLGALSHLYATGEIDFETFFPAIWGYTSARRVVDEHPMAENVAQSILGEV